MAGLGSNLGRSLTGGAPRPPAPQAQPQVGKHHSIAGYENETLAITFPNGATYQFDGVSTEVYEAVARSPSVGKAYHQFIKGNYTGRKV